MGSGFSFNKLISRGWIILLGVAVIALFQAKAVRAEVPPEMEELEEATAVLESLGEEVGKPAVGEWKSGRPISTEMGFLRAESYLVGPDWEFDGFVAGGQDKAIKNMYVVNDLLYLNVGFVQGIETGDRLTIFKRGSKVRDPQTGRFIGYEIRQAAISLVTDQVNEETCAVRIIQTFEPVEIGDIVRRM